MYTSVVLSIFTLLCNRSLELFHLAKLKHYTHVIGFPSFSKAYYFIMYIYHILFIHLSVIGYSVGGFHSWLLWVCKYLFEIQLWILLDIYPEVGLLGYANFIWFYFEEPAYHFLSWLHHFTFLPRMHKGFSFSRPLSTTSVFHPFSHCHGCEVVSDCGFDLLFSYF